MDCRKNKHRLGDLDTPRRHPHTRYSIKTDMFLLVVEWITPKSWTLASGVHLQLTIGAVIPGPCKIQNSDEEISIRHIFFGLGECQHVERRPRWNDISFMCVMVWSGCCFRPEAKTDPQRRTPQRSLAVQGYW